MKWDFKFSFFLNKSTRGSWIWQHHTCREVKNWQNQGVHSGCFGFENSVIVKHKYTYIAKFYHEQVQSSIFARRLWNLTIYFRWWTLTILFMEPRGFPNIDHNGFYHTSTVNVSITTYAYMTNFSVMCAIWELSPLCLHYCRQLLHFACSISYKVNFLIASDH